MKDKPSCQCTYCKACCHHKPGMLRPDDVGRIAGRLGLTTKELFDKHLAVDAVHDVDRDTYVLVPASVQADNAGGIYRKGEGGRCVFLREDGRCGIQDVKPFECRATDHTTEFSRVRERVMARPWRKVQPALEWLFGRKLPDRAVVGLEGWAEPPRNPPTPFQTCHPIFGVTEMDIVRSMKRRLPRKTKGGKR